MPKKNVSDVAASLLVGLDVMECVGEDAALALFIALWPVLRGQMNLKDAREWVERGITQCEETLSQARAEVRAERN